MKIKFKLSHYLGMYILFAALYTLNFKDHINLINLKICLTSSIFPAVIGGSVINLLFNKKIECK